MAISVDFLNQGLLWLGKFINLLTFNKKYYYICKQNLSCMSALDKRDEASRNLLAGQCQQFEKYIWFLKSFK